MAATLKMNIATFKMKMQEASSMKQAFWKGAQVYAVRVKAIIKAKESEVVGLRAKSEALKKTAQVHAVKMEALMKAQVKKADDLRTENEALRKAGQVHTVKMDAVLKAPVSEVLGLRAENEALKGEAKKREEYVRELEKRLAKLEGKAADSDSMASDYEML